MNALPITALSPNISPVQPCDPVTSSRSSEYVFSSSNYGEVRPGRKNGRALVSEDTWTPKCTTASSLAVHPDDGVLMHQLQLRHDYVKFTAGSYQVRGNSTRFLKLGPESRCLHLSSVYRPFDAAAVSFELGVRITLIEEHRTQTIWGTRQRKQWWEKF